MNRVLVITIDVEPDCSYNWRYSSPLTFRGVSEGIANRLQPLFNKYGIAPTYLINNVVLEDSASCDVLRNLNGKYELGTHLHPEFIAPQKSVWNYSGQKGEANCCFYPADIEFGKIESITNLFSDRFGYYPSSFRAGRFSAGANTINSLEKLGYKTDTSVTPHVNWNDKTRIRPVDFTHAPEQPYFVRSGTILEESGDGKILQVPVSIVNRKTSVLKELRRAYFGLRHTMMSYRPLWLRPVFSTSADFISIVEEYEHTYSSNETIVYNMMFHNVEVMPGLSPYSATESDCKNYLVQLETFFKYCAEKNITGSTLTDVYDLYR